MRRLPIYLLLDVSESTKGKPLEALINGVESLIDGLKQEPQALETIHLSIITFGGTAQQIVPLTDVQSFQVPQLRAGGSRVLGAALELLDGRLEVEVKKPTRDEKGDWKPIIFLLTDGIPSDDWRKGAEEIKKRSMQVVACAAGVDADINVLKQITENVIELRSASKNDIAAFFRWETQKIEIPIVSIKATNGTTIEYIDDVIGEGGMKKVYFTSDKKHVVAFYKEKPDYREKERLISIVEKFNPTTELVLGNYWKSLFSWPTHIVDGERFGIVVPKLPKHFFFEAGPMKGKEKNSKWFISTKLRRLLDQSEKGTWINYFQISILISRAVRKIHEYGLAHPDLSYNNVLIDPKGVHVLIRGIDEIIPPNGPIPRVLGTPDFIAPELYKSIKFDFRDKNRKFPSIETDLHSLAVLIYMLLLYRHPLRGGKVHDLDPNRDEELSMGEKALFIEHPTDKSNRPKEKDPASIPWADVDKIPCTGTGPYLKELFERAFINGLHNAIDRPTAEEWEAGLTKTIGLMHPCDNPECEQKWFMFDYDTKPQCPFCELNYS